ncbi:MAG: sulfate adenylyltransferase subunit CysN [Rhizobiales bacterium]|nr:sulfate adenylyltransferase subunit CysN [Hyphomicrobiales bacterium]
MGGPASTDVAASLAGATTLPALRFLTCGSVDDGKSTLIGRLLYEQNLIFDDHLAALERDSKKHGTTGAEIDFALLLDGLEAEREQGITIDVAYRYFSTKRRAFIVADTPGHEQYTRNMATGASNADVAVLLVDARKGLLTQTHRHAVIASLLGIRYAVLAVNKIDLVEYDRTAFDRITADFFEFAATLGFKDLKSIPISARYGDNVSKRSERTPWYSGPHLLEYLEAVDVEDGRSGKPFRMPVQWVNRPNSDFRGFAGTIASGRVKPSDEIAVLPSGRTARIKAIVGAGGDVEAASAGDSVTITLADEIDIARGDMFAAVRERPQVADQFAAHLVWMSSENMFPGRSYLMKINNSTLAATVTELKHQLDVNTMSKLAAKTLALNDVGICNLSVARPVAFDPYADNRDTGAFILIDRYSNETVAAGMIDFALRRATNIHHQNLTVSKAERSRLMHHRPAVLWFTGLPGAGKSTIANLVEAGLNARGIHSVMLDGDNVRHGLNKDLGFTESDRVENIRRIGEVAKLMIDAGLIVLCSFISPFRAERRMVRGLLDAGEFIEVFVDTPLDQCIARDPKGLYRRALAGEIKNFTGVDQPYETPENPELHLLAGRKDPDKLANEVIEELARKKIV